MILLIIGLFLGVLFTTVVFRCCEGNAAEIRYVYHRNKNWWGCSTHIITDDGAGSVSVSVEDENPNVATIHALSVIPSKRRKGYATDLIDAAEDEARYLGASIALISSEKGNFTADWYQRLGYSFDGEDEHLIQYVKNLRHSIATSLPREQVPKLYDIKPYFPAIEENDVKASLAHQEMLRKTLQRTMQEYARMYSNHRKK